MRSSGKTREIPKEKWEWFGMAGHYIVGHLCQFHLCTKVGDILVSTVGRLPKMGGGGFQEIGLSRKYETMVFYASGSCDCGCGNPGHKGWDIDFRPYNDEKSATKGHMRLCRKWAKQNAEKRKTKKGETQK